MVRRYELTDAQFATIEGLLPKNGKRGRSGTTTAPPSTASSGCSTPAPSRREVPERYGKWKSVYNRFRRWRKDRTIDSILERLHRKLDEAGRIDHELSVHRRHEHPRQSLGGRDRREGPADEPSDHALGRSRGGFGTKLHLIVDGHGIPLSVSASPGQAHESKHVEPVLEAVRLPRPGRGRPRRRPRRLAGDKGYSYPRVRRYLRRRGIVAVIPTRKDQRRNPRFDTQVYRRRNVVERCVNWLKESRRLGTRHEKLAVHFVAMAKWAMIRRCLRLLDSSDRP